MAYTNKKQGGGMQSPHLEAYNEIMKKYREHQQKGSGERDPPKIYITCVNPDCITNQRDHQQGGLEFYVESGFYMCESCDSLNGYARGYYDMKEYDRFYYRKKSIYQRKYHYENKVKDISKRLALTDDEQYCLYNKLMEIEEKHIDEINEHFNRKRMINVFYLIKKLLKEMGCEKYKQIGLKLSKKTFQKYEKWWKMYKSKKGGYILDSLVGGSIKSLINQNSRPVILPRNDHCLNGESNT